MGVGLCAAEAGLRPLLPDEARGAALFEDERGLPPSMRDQVGPDAEPDLPEGLRAAEE
jgi:hypothetical protein